MILNSGSDQPYPVTAGFTVKCLLEAWGAGMAQW